MNWFHAIFYNLNTRILEKSSVNKRDAEMSGQTSRVKIGEDYMAKSNEKNVLPLRVYVG